MMTDIVSNLLLTDDRSHPTKRSPLNYQTVARSASASTGLKVNSQVMTAIAS
ncbi:hypothetical protein [Trichocoleus sp. DQ-U1]